MWDFNECADCGEHLKHGTRIFECTPNFLPSTDRSNEENLLYLIIKQGYLVEKDANLRRDSEKQFHFPPPHVQEFLIAANIVLRFPSDGANDDTGQNKSEIHDGEKLLYVIICFHGIKRGLRTQCSVPPFFLHLASRGMSKGSRPHSEVAYTPEPWSHLRKLRLRNIFGRFGVTQRPRPEWHVGRHGRKAWLKDVAEWRGLGVAGKRGRKAWLKGVVLGCAA